MAARKRGARGRGKPGRSKRGEREGLLLDRDALRRLRLERGFTQQALAQQRAQLDGETVSISYAQIRRIESEGRAGPGTARILAALLGVELAQLRGRGATRNTCGLPREPSVDFVGRQAELEAVLQILERQGSARIAAAVEGLPGIGKTELALQVCAHCDRSGTYRIFWFDAQGGDLRNAWSNTVAPHLGIEHTDPEMRSKLALRAVESSGEPTLLVLDNLEQWSQTQPWPRPQGTHIRWLITTRISRLGDRAFDHVELPVLDAASARELFVRIAGSELAARPGFEALLAHLDGYTIALELAAAFLGRFPEVGPYEYLKVLLENKRDALEGEVADRTPYQITLDHALAMLWHRLSPSLQNAWVLAARFEQDRATHALSDACGLTRRVRAELRDFHLIQGDAEGWTMHRLMRGFGRRVGGGEQQQAARQQFLRGCIARAHLIMNLYDGLQIYTPDRTHYEAALSAMEGSGIEPEAAAAYHARLGSALHSLGELSRAKELKEKAIELRLGDVGENHQDVAEYRSNLANLLRLQGDLPSAKELHQRALDSLVNLLGEDHPSVAACRSNLALVLNDLGDCQQARVLLEKAMASGIRTLGENHADLSLRRSILALITLKLGEISHAQQLIEGALRVTTHAEAHPQAIQFRAILAQVLQEQGELARARSLLEEVLQAACQTFGEDHPRVIDYQRLLSGVFHRLGELPRAQALLETALESGGRLLGADHPTGLVTRTALAEVLRDRGRLRIAREFAEQSLQANLRAWPSDHPQIAETRRVLARVLHALGERDDALEQLREARRVAHRQPEGSLIRGRIDRTAEELL